MKNYIFHKVATILLLNLYHSVATVSESLPYKVKATVLGIPITLYEGDAGEPTPVEDLVIPMPPKVVDLQNKPLQVGKSYVIMYGTKAGVGFEKKNMMCPLYVAQHLFTETLNRPCPLFFWKFGNLPVGVSTSENDRRTIYEGSSIAIEFDERADGLCKDPVGWEVVEEEDVNGKMTGFVRTGGNSVRKASRRVSNNVFQIINTGGIGNPVTGTPVYKLQNCPQSVSPLTGQVEGCRDIGVLSDPITGKPFLVVNHNNPFLIEFQETH